MPIGFRNLLTPNHFAANLPGAGPLVNPWAITRAPANFGQFSNAILIGNVEDEKINAFSDSGEFLGPLVHTDNTPIVIPGLWVFDFAHVGVPTLHPWRRLAFWTNSFR